MQLVEQHIISKGDPRFHGIDAHGLRNSIHHDLVPDAR